MPQKTCPPDFTPHRVPERLQISGPSSSPGIALMEAIAHSRKPLPEDLAILNSWRFRFPITIVEKLPNK